MNESKNLNAVCPNRRIFLKYQENFFRLFSFTQDPDGSIYVSWPDFSDTEWCSVETLPSGEVRPIKVDSTSEGKLSIHGSGIAAFRAHNEPQGHRLRIKGNQLFNAEKKESGARHLFTFFSKKPIEAVESSPPYNRRSDYIMETREHEPWVTLFFALPQVLGGLQTSFQIGFSMDDLKNIPPRSGGGHFNLLHHDVFWFTYETKHMEDWPKKNQVFYYDGFLTPVIIGTDRGMYRLELRPPKYSLIGNSLSVEV